MRSKRARLDNSTRVPAVWFEVTEISLQKSTPVQTHVEMETPIEASDTNGTGKPTGFFSVYFDGDLTFTIGQKFTLKGV